MRKWFELAPRSAVPVSGEAPDSQPKGFPSASNSSTPCQSAPSIPSLSSLPNIFETREKEREKEGVQSKKQEKKEEKKKKRKERRKKKPFAAISEHSSSLSSP